MKGVKRRLKMFIEKDEYFEIEEFEKSGIRAVYTKQSAGNMSLYCLNEEKKVEENRKKIMKNIGISDKKLFFARQTHSDNIKIIREEDIPKEYDDIDGFITDRKDVAILTQYADCLPVYYHDVNNRVIGSAHGGWKGLFNGIHIKMIDIIIEEYSINIEDIIVGVGIGIKSCCYQVGEEFYKNFQNKFGETADKSFVKIDGSYNFDLETFAKITLLEKGVKEKNITVSGVCTMCSKKFNSFRKDKEMSGRNGAIIAFK